jgi:hypothetical protein
MTGPVLPSKMSLDDVLSYFTRVVVFLTNALVYGENEGLVKPAGHVVIGLSN